MEFRDDIDYVHITSNNTIYGTRYVELPETKGIPIVSDMSSSILSEEIEVEKYGLIYAGAQKNVSINEPFFQGHFPVLPVMPGVLTLEAMAQATGLLAMETAPDTVNDTLYYLVGVDKARFKSPVVPGDQLMIEMMMISNKRGFWKFSGEARVDGKVVVSAEIICSPKALD